MFVHWRLLYGRATNLAGRVDCVAEFDGELSIIDFKGSTRKKRISDIDNYFMQATAMQLHGRKEVKQPSKPNRYSNRFGRWC